MALVPVLTRKQKRFFNLGAVVGAAALSASRPARLLVQRSARSGLSNLGRFSLRRIKLKTTERGIVTSRAKFKDVSFVSGIIRKSLKRLAQTPGFKARELRRTRAAFTRGRKNQALSVAAETLRRRTKAAATRAANIAKRK